MNPRFQQAMACLEEIKQNGLMGKTLRPAQEKALRMMIYLVYNQNKKYVSLTAPTGSGKSHIAACWAVIANEVDGWKSNITTSSRALQKQYGETLKVDERFKVVMGGANYRCSLFWEEKGEKKKQRALIPNQWSPVSMAPCQDYEKDFDYEYADIKTAFKRDEKQIMTIHEDQDMRVLGNISDTIEALETPELGVDSMGKLKRMCVECESCSYTVARSEADSAVAAIRSFQHLLFYIMYRVSQQMSPILQQREVHILDECHNIDAVFRDFFSTTLNTKTYQDSIAKTMNKLAKGEDISIETNFERFKQSEGKSWLEGEKALLCQQISQDLGKVIDKTIVKLENGLRKEAGRPLIKDSLEFLKEAVSGQSILDPDSLSKEPKQILKWYKNMCHANADARNAARAKSVNQKHNKRYARSVQQKNGTLEINVFPVTLEGMANQYFGEEHTIFMSATPQPAKIFEKMFGISGQVGYVEVPSDFPPERSPIFLDPVETITIDRAKEMGMKLLDRKAYKSQTAFEIEATERGFEQLYAMIASRIRDIIDQLGEVPGIIPCSSYKMVQGLQPYLDDIPRFIWATDGTLNREMVEKFKKEAAEKSLILVSAGIVEGHSFDDDISRFQIIPKMPFSAHDDVMKEMCERWGNHFYTAKTAMTLQQMVGRSMRSANDHCVTIVLDKKFEVLKNKSVSQFYSQHFMSCIRWDEKWENFERPD